MLQALWDNDLGIPLEGMAQNIEQIARIAHEANRAYCQSLGDFSHEPWDKAPGWQRGSAISGVIHHLKCHAEGHTPEPSWSHQMWLEQKRAEGWKYGAVKDAVTKEHPCFVSYHELPAEQRLKDYLFGGVVRAFAECRADASEGHTVK